MVTTYRHTYISHTHTHTHTHTHISHLNLFGSPFLNFHMDKNNNTQCTNTHTYTHKPIQTHIHTPYRPTLHNSQPLPNRNQEMEETMLHVAICVIWFGFVKKVGTLCLSGSPILRFNYAPSSLTSVFGQVSQFSATLVPLPIFSWILVLW